MKKKVEFTIERKETITTVRSFSFIQEDGNVMHQEILEKLHKGDDILGVFESCSISPNVSVEHTSISSEKEYKLFGFRTIPAPYKIEISLDEFLDEVRKTNNTRKIAMMAMELTFELEDFCISENMKHGNGNTVANGLIQARFNALRTNLKNTTYRNKYSWLDTIKDFLNDPSFREELSQHGVYLEVLWH